MASVPGHPTRRWQGSPAPPLTGPAALGSLWEKASCADSLVCMSGSENGKQVGGSLERVWLFPEVSTKPDFALLSSAFQCLQTLLTVTSLARPSGAAGQGRWVIQRAWKPGTVAAVPRSWSSGAEVLTFWSTMLEGRRSKLGPPRVSHERETKRYWVVHRLLDKSIIFVWFSGY